MPYVPESQRDTSWYIFEKLFRCKLRFIDTMSADYIKIFGMPSLYDKVEDRATATELNDYYISIAKMAEYFKKGVTVRVVDPKDTKEIYERVLDHTTAWKNHLTRTLYTKDAPVEDLILLDEFASVVYTHAKRHFTREYVNSSLFNAMMAAAPTPFAETPGGLSKEEAKKIDDSTHQKMSDVFNQYRTTAPEEVDFFEQNRTGKEEPDTPFSWS